MNEEDLKFNESMIQARIDAAVNKRLESLDVNKVIDERVEVMFKARLLQQQTKQAQDLIARKALAEKKIAELKEIRKKDDPVGDMALMSIGQARGKTIDTALVKPIFNIFGIDGTPSFFTEFGNNIQSQDPSLIMGTDEFRIGWEIVMQTGAEYPPPVEWWNSALLAAFYTIGYLIQRGIPQWSSDVRFEQYSYQVGSDGRLYFSKVPANTGNNPISVPAAWGKIVETAFNINDNFSAATMQATNAWLNSLKNVANGIAGLGSDSKVPIANLPFQTTITNTDATVATPGAVARALSPVGSSVILINWTPIGGYPDNLDFGYFQPSYSAKDLFLFEVRWQYGISGGIGTNFNCVKSQVILASDFFAPSDVGSRYILFENTWYSGSMRLWQFVISMWVSNLKILRLTNGVNNSEDGANSTMAFRIIQIKFA